MDRQGNTPLIIAVKNDGVALVKVLLEAGADTSSENRMVDVLRMNKFSGFFLATPGSSPFNIASYILYEDYTPSRRETPSLQLRGFHHDTFFITHIFHNKYLHSQIISSGDSPACLCICTISHFLLASVLSIFSPPPFCSISICF